MYDMITTIRNLDARVYREIKAQAALEDITVGELLSRAAAWYLQQCTASSKPRRHLRELKPIRFPEGNENLSAHVDEVLVDEN